MAEQETEAEAPKLNVTEGALAILEAMASVGHTEDQGFVFDVQDRNEGHTFIRVPVVKATTTGKEGETSYIEFDTDELPIDVYKEVLVQGLKTLLNRGMSKVTGTKTMKTREAAWNIAKENAKKLYAGEVRMSAGTRTKVSGAVKTEAMRLARAIIKDALKAQKKKVSHIKGSEITLAAKAFLEGDLGAEVWAKAKTNIEERDRKEAALSKLLAGVVSEIKVDPDLAAKSESRKKPKKGDAPQVAPKQAHRPEARAH